MKTDGPIRGAVIRFLVWHPWLILGLIAGLVGVGSALVVVSGVVPIKASSGHWRITSQLLDFAKMRSVATHSLGVTAPDLTNQAMVIRGAAHYESGCHPCHGKPGVPVPPVMAAMTPAPPALTTRVARFRPEELFLIVKDGIKFTGMPAWPAQQRDDEVWAVVAFLRRLPSLDAESYRRITGGADTAGAPSTFALGATPDTSSAPSAVRQVCWRCHGADGMGGSLGAFPSLAGQRASYLEASLKAFANRTRFSGIMSPVAAALDDQAMREVATYYETLPPRPARATDAERDAVGTRLATVGAPVRDIPACLECHGAGTAPKNPAYPRLAGQHAPYLRAQLELMQQRRRGGTPNVDLMHVFVNRLTAAEIGAVSGYLAGAEQ
jgi:cytochrome c553